MNITNLITKELSNSTEADPHKIATKLLNIINHKQTEEILTRGLVELIKEQIRFNRIESNTDRSADNNPGPSRRSIAIQARVKAQNQWKMLVECNIDDLNSIAIEYKDRAQKMYEKSRYYELLAEELQCSGYATVGEMWAQQEQKTAA